MSNPIYDTPRYAGLPEALPSTTDDATDAIYIARPDALPKDRRLRLKHLTPQALTLTANTASPQALDLSDYNTDLTVTVTGTYTGGSFPIELSGSLPIGRTLTVITDSPFRQVTLGGLPSHTGVVQTYGSIQVSFGEEGTVGVLGDGPGDLQHVGTEWKFKSGEGMDLEALKAILATNSNATIIFPHGYHPTLSGSGTLTIGGGLKRIILPLDEASTAYQSSLTIQGYTAISGLLHVEGVLEITAASFEILTDGVSAKYLDAKTITNKILTYEYLIAGKGTIKRKTKKYSLPLRAVVSIPDTPQLWNSAIGGIVYTPSVIGTWDVTFPAIGDGFNPEVGDKIELYIVASTTPGTPTVTISTTSGSVLSAPISHFPMANGSGGYDYTNSHGPIQGTLIFNGGNRWVVQNGMPLTPNLYNYITNDSPNTTDEWMSLLGGLYYRLTGGGALNLTLPAAIPHATAGAWIDLFPGSGAGLSITPDPGVTINGAGSPVNSDVGRMNRLICVAPNEWIYTKP